MSKDNKNIWSSEAIKAGIIPDIENMTEEEVKNFRNSLDPDTMGFDGMEFIGEVDEDEA